MLSPMLFPGPDSLFWWPTGLVEALRLPTGPVGMLGLCMLVGASLLPLGGGV